MAETVGIKTSGGTKIVKAGSKAYNKYVSQGGTLISSSDLNRAKEASKARTMARMSAGTDYAGKPLDSYVNAEDRPKVPEIGAPGALEEQIQPETPQVPETADTIRKQATDYLSQQGYTSPDEGEVTGAINKLGLSNKYQAAHQQQISGGIAPPASGGVGEVQGMVGPTPVDNSAALFATDTNSYDGLMSGLMATYRDYMDPKNQRDSLVEEYQSLLEKTGIEAINTELIDMKNVIEGSEDDIRTEITKAGGFATDSQVMALTNARNKQLIKNYNTLLETRNSKENYLNTMIGLEAQDRQAADQRFNTQFNMGMQIVDYGQRMQQNAVSQFQWLAGQPGGFEAIQEQAMTNPHTASMVNKLLGGSGGLQKMVTQVAVDREADRRYKQAMIDNVYSQIAERNEPKELTSAQNIALGYGTRLVQAGDIIGKVGTQFADRPQISLSVFGKELVPNVFKSGEQKQYEQAKRNFINAVLRRESGAAIAKSEFDSAERQYFPRLGDDPITLANKEANRVLVVRNFLREGGQDVNPYNLVVSPDGSLIEIAD